MNPPANLKRMLFLAGIFLFSLNVQAQLLKKYVIPGLDTSFLIGGAASSVLKNGQAEILSSTSLISYWVATHENGENSPVLDRVRQTQFSSDWYGFYGISPTGRWDVGLHVRYLRSRLDNAATSPVFKVFEKDNGEGDDLSDRSFGGVSNVGLRFRVSPFGNLRELVITGGYDIATIKDRTKQQGLFAERDVAEIGLTYYKEIATHTLYFFSGRMITNFPSSIEDSEQDYFLFNTDLSFFLVQRTNNQKFLFYPGLTYSLGFKPSKFDDRSMIKTTEFFFGSMSVQYTPSPKYNVFVSGRIPLLANNTHPNQKIVRESFSDFSVGLRAMIAR